MRVKLLVLILGLALSLMAVAQPNKLLSIGVGTVGGPFYAYGSGLASVLSRAMGQPVTAEVTGGAIENLRLLNQGKVDLTMSTSGLLADAFNGRGRFSVDGAMPLRTLLVLYPNRMHVAVLAGSGINSVKDLKGKRISTGTELGVSAIVAPRILDAAGIGESDYKRFEIDRASAIQSLKDGRIDAMFYASGDQIFELTDVALAFGNKLKLLPTDQYVAAINKKYGPIYVKDTVRLRANLSSNATVGVVGVWSLLAVKAAMNDEAAYNLVKMIFARQPDMIAITALARNVSRENQSNDNSPIPFHPGAIKYFAERGLSLK